MMADTAGATWLKIFKGVLENKRPWKVKGGLRASRILIKRTQDENCLRVVLYLSM